MGETWEELLKRQDEELPRLPVPPLPLTMETYLASVKPFLTDEEYQTTEKSATDFFCGDVAARLQKLLQDKAASTRNWLADWWINVAYLDNRTPLPVYSNSAYVFPPVNLTPDFDWLKLAAAVIAANLDFKIKLIDENVMPPLKIGNRVVSMDQSQNFYSACRIPGEKRDRLRVKIPSTARHIIVMRRNHIFMVPVYDKMDKLLNQSQILDQLKNVVENSQTPSSTPIGVLTTENRTVWWKARESLLQTCQENRHNFDLIETGLFLVSLDKPLSKNELQKGGRLLGIIERSMHGGNVDISEAANRWVDTICQLIVTESGEIGFPFEHSPVDANPSLTDFMADFWTDMKGKDLVPPAGPYEPPKKLIFTVPGDVKAILPKAFSNIKELAESLDVYPFVYGGYGRKFIRNLKIGTADSFIQIALQFTFYKMYDTPSAQYESASTRTFLCGRTETIRSCSLESVTFARTMLNPNATYAEQGRALRSAMDAHKDYVMKAMMGYGIDRHLLGLRLIAAENNIQIPQLFLQDPGYTRSTNMRLSTSQVPGKVRGTSLFGPLTHDGYGCCYNPMPEEIIFAVTAFTTCQETSAAKFSQILQESLNAMKDVASKIVPSDKL